MDPEVRALVDWFFSSLDEAAKQILIDPTKVCSITLGGTNAKRMLCLIAGGILDSARRYLKRKYNIDAIVVYVARMEIINSLYIIVADRRMFPRVRGLMRQIKNQLSMFSFRRAI